MNKIEAMETLAKYRGIRNDQAEPSDLREAIAALDIYPDSTTADGDTIIEVVYATDRLLKATTLTEQGAAADALSNAVHDLKTWHPDYNYETGEIEGMYV